MFSQTFVVVVVVLEKSLGEFCCFPFGTQSHGFAFLLKVTIRKAVDGGLIHDDNGGSSGCYTFVPVFWQQKGGEGKGRG